MRRLLVASAVLLGPLLATGCGSPDADPPAAQVGTPSGTRSAPSSGCADVVVLGLRGQGQSARTSAGVGAEVLGTVRAIGRRLPASVRLVAVRHPARATATQAAYDADVATGVRLVRRQLTRLARTCPDSQVGLVGFSEGAQVVHLAAARTRRPLAFVVLMGDPLRRATGDAGVRDLAFGTRVGGRGSNGPGPAFPARLHGRVVEACVAGDNVCDVPPTGRVGGVSETHRHFYERPGTSRRIAHALR